MKKSVYLFKKPVLEKAVISNNKISLQDLNGDTVPNHEDPGKLLVHEWKERSATISEAIIKAERHHNPDITIEELQKQTIIHIHKEEKPRVSQDMSKTFMNPQVHLRKLD